MSLNRVGRCRQPRRVAEIPPSIAPAVRRDRVRGGRGAAATLPTAGPSPPRCGARYPSLCRVAGSRQPVAAGRGVSVSSFPRCGEGDPTGGPSTLSAPG